VVATIAAIDAGGKAPGTSAASGSAAAASPVVASATGNEVGKKLFENVCSACHGMGIAGSPKFGDKAAWAPRIAKGLDTLYDHAIHGFQGNNGVMPPKGGSSASDDDVKAAVRYMVDAAK
jgi:cytochrome c5